MAQIHPSSSGPSSHSGAVIFDAASFGNYRAEAAVDAVEVARGRPASFFSDPFDGGAGGVHQRRVVPCGAIMLGDTHIDTQTLFKFAFFAEAVVVSTLICALMRRYVLKNRHIIIKEDVNAWAKIL